MGADGPRQGGARHPTPDPQHLEPARLVARPVWQQAPGSRPPSRHPGAPSTHRGPDFAVLQQDQGGGGLALVARLVPDNGALRVRVAAHFDVAWRRAGRRSGRGAGGEERRALAGRGRRPARPPSHWQAGRQARNRGGPGERRQAAPAAGLPEAAGRRAGRANGGVRCLRTARGAPPAPAAARRKRGLLHGGALAGWGLTNGLGIWIPRVLLVEQSGLCERRQVRQGQAGDPTGAAAGAAAWAAGWRRRRRRRRRGEARAGGGWPCVRAPCPRPAPVCAPQRSSRPCRRQRISWSWRPSPLRRWHPAVRAWSAPA